MVKLTGTIFCAALLGGVTRAQPIPEPRPSRPDTQPARLTPFRPLRPPVEAPLPVLPELTCANYYHENSDGSWKLRNVWYPSLTERGILVLEGDRFNSATTSHRSIATEQEDGSYYIAEKVVQDCTDGWRGCTAYDIEDEWLGAAGSNCGHGFVQNSGCYQNAYKNYADTLSNTHQCYNNYKEEQREGKSKYGEVVFNHVYYEKQDGSSNTVPHVVQYYRANTEEELVVKHSFTAVTANGLKEPCDHTALPDHVCQDLGDYKCQINGETADTHGRFGSCSAPLSAPLHTATAGVNKDCSQMSQAQHAC